MQTDAPKIRPPVGIFVTPFAPRLPANSALASNIVKKISETNAVEFSELLPSDIKENLSGVYFIATKKHEILYVGKASNLRRRIYTNQLQGNLSTARLKKYLIEDKELPEIDNPKKAKEWIKKICYFKILTEEDIRNRAEYEHLLSYYLSPRYLDLIR